MDDNKVTTLEKAIKTFVHSGDCIVFGGNTTNRKPYAAVHEIIRQGIKDLYIIGMCAGGDSDMLIGAGSCRAYANAYCANSGYTNVCRRYRKYIEEGKILVEDYSLDVLPTMIHAAALGLPYVPLKNMLGSDLVNKWGIPEEIREKDKKLNCKKLIIDKNPFKPDELVCLVPTPEIDVAILHVQKASPEGIVRIEGGLLYDLDCAMAAKRLIVTCEELVESNELRRQPHYNQLPSIVTDAVVPVPFGAHPSQVFNYYDYDKEFLRMYDRISRDDVSFQKFLKEWVFDLENHEQYLQKIGIGRLLNLRVVKGLGYVPSVEGGIQD